MSKPKQPAQDDTARTEASPAPSSLIQDRREQFAEDLVYTLNHAIVCATSDVIDPFIGAWTQKRLGRRLVINPLHDWAHNKYEHHDHDHHHHEHHHHDHDHHHGKHEHHHHHDENFWGNLGHWAVGEAVGDIGAVPFTLAMQHYTPGIMRGIQTMSEPIMGPVFNWSSNRYAQKWGYEHGFEADSEEVKARAQEMYQHEVSHLPHALVWTGSAAAGNILTQRYVTGNKAPWRSLILGKAFGSIGTLSLVMLFRSLAPHKIQQLDEWNAKNLAEPLTRRIGGWFGVDSDTVTRVLDREREFEDGHQLLERKRERKQHGKEAAGDKPEKQIEGESAQHLSPLQFSKLIG